MRLSRVSRKAGGLEAKGKPLRYWAPYTLTALLIWLGWQMVVGLLVQRSPIDTALRVAPSSGQVLSRAAEAELVGGRADNARAFAELALILTPFDVRALRVLGLAVASTDANTADDLLTLAGNWSLRDDPSHAWLIQRRLEQGDYAGAFAHADALARRREDVRPRIFSMFNVAAVEDPRSVAFLIARLAANPNWRGAYLNGLRSAEAGPQIQAVIALGLEGGPGRLTNPELEAMYGEWVREGRLLGVRELRRRLRRPPPTPLQGGGFEVVDSPLPFNWQTESGPGAQAEISARADSQSKALFVETDGFSSRTVATQLLLLDQGYYSFGGRYLHETGGREPRMAWSIRCVETSSVIATWAPTSTEEEPAWKFEEMTFSVPENCSAQRLELRTLRGPRRTTIVAWFDNLFIAPAATAPHS